MYEVHFSDGMRQMKRFKSLKAAQIFVAGKLSFDKQFPDKEIRLQNIEIFSTGPRFHSTTQYEFLLSWWGGGYWENISKGNPKVLEKKIELNSFILKHL